MQNRTRHIFLVFLCLYVALLIIASLPNQQMRGSLAELSYSTERFLEKAHLTAGATPFSEFMPSTRFLRRFCLQVEDAKMHREIYRSPWCDQAAARIFSDSFDFFILRLTPFWAQEPETPWQRQVSENTANYFCKLSSQIEHRADTKLLFHYTAVMTDRKSQRSIQKNLKTISWDCHSHASMAIFEFRHGVH